ncbi:MAG: hypothetical protein ACRDK5_00750 [Solirubrobacterales bacterium]
MAPLWEVDFGAVALPARGAKDTPGIVTLAFGEEFLVSKEQSTAELVELIRQGMMFPAGRSSRAARESSR